MCRVDQLWFLPSLQQGSSNNCIDADDLLSGGVCLCRSHEGIDGKSGPFLVLTLNRVVLHYRDPQLTALPLKMLSFCYSSVFPNCPLFHVTESQFVWTLLAPDPSSRH